MSENRPTPIVRARMHSVSSQVSIERPNPSTLGAWGVALLPAAPFIVALGIVTAVNGAIDLPVLVILLVLGLIASVGAASTDRTELRSRGFENCASPWLAVVPLAYLWKRADAFSGIHFVNAPLWAHVLAVPVAIATFSIWSNVVMATG